MDNKSKPVIRRMVATTKSGSTVTVRRLRSGSTNVVVKARGNEDARDVLRNFSRELEGDDSNA